MEISLVFVLTSIDLNCRGLASTCVRNSPSVCFGPGFVFPMSRWAKNARTSTMKILQRRAGLVDAQDIRILAPGARGLGVLEDPEAAGGLRGGAVGGHRHEVDLARDVELAHQVGEEEHRALEDADEQQVPALVV